MKLSVGNIAKSAGVSVRTIQYYDRIGLLKPVEINSQNGYRYYDEKSVEQLNEILYYKGLDFPLKEIPALISSNGLNSSSRLLEQRKNLIEKKKHIEQQLNLLDDELSESKKIEPWFDKILADYNYSGFSYTHDEKESFVVWGKADYEKNIPFSMNCRFVIGFAYFHFLAFCILLLEDKGMLNADDYLCGLSTDDDINSLVHQWEKDFGKGTGEILEEYIFTPLGMDNTSWGGATNVIGYYEGKPIEINYTDGIVTTAEDLIKWCDVLAERKMLSENGYKKFFSQGEYFCGLYHNGNNYSIEATVNEITFEFNIDTENGHYYFSVRNQAPIPDNRDLIMCFPVICCDDGYVKLEVWKMQSGTEVKVNSVKVFDENAKELYCDKGCLIDVRNDGEECHAEKIADSGYYYELDLAKFLGDSFDRTKNYVIEARAECPPQEYAACAQLGFVYKHDGEWQSGYHNVFFNHFQAYDLFLCQLNCTKNIK